MNIPVYGSCSHSLPPSCSQMFYFFFHFSYCIIILHNNCLLNFCYVGYYFKKKIDIYLRQFHITPPFFKHFIGVIYLLVRVGPLCFLINNDAPLNAPHHKKYVDYNSGCLHRQYCPWPQASTGYLDSPCHYQHRLEDGAAFQLLRHCNAIASPYCCPHPLQAVEFTRLLGVTLGLDRCKVWGSTSPPSSR